MSPRPKVNRVWSFGRKFSLWLADNSLSLNAFAHNHGFAQSTLQGWTKRDVKIPAAELARIALATRLPVAYWLDEAVPYPPPLDYENFEDRLRSVLLTMPPEELREAISALEQPDERRRLFAIRRAATSGGSAPTPSRTRPPS